MYLDLGEPTRCQQFTRNHGCSPWRLSWCEMIVHLIPLIGIATSGFAACWRSRTVKFLENVVYMESGSSPTAYFAIGDDQIDEVPNPLDENFLSNPLSAEDRKELILAKRANNYAICAINTVYTLVLAGVGAYLTYRFAQE